MPCGSPLPTVGFQPSCVQESAGTLSIVHCCVAASFHAAHRSKFVCWPVACFLRDLTTCCSDIYDLPHEIWGSVHRLDSGGFSIQRKAAGSRRPSHETPEAFKRSLASPRCDREGSTFCCADCAEHGPGAPK